MIRQRRDSIQQLLEEWERERPDLDPSPVGIQGRIVRLSAHLLRRAEVYLGELDLSWEAFSLIVTLRRSGKPYELRPTDILRESLLTSGAVTNRIDRVEKMGLIERYPDPSDRRGYLVRLTPAGKRIADRAIQNHFSEMDRLLNALSTQERATLSKLLSKLLVAFES